LVHYIRSMSTEEQRQAAVLNRDTIVVRSVDTVPADPKARVWTEIRPISIRMAPLWWRDNADPDLQVQAVHDDKKMAVRISWKDEVRDGHAVKSESFEDAVAMELYRGDAEPFLGMGSGDQSVDVWFWDADRQSVIDVEDQYPRVVDDIYPFSEQSVETAEYARGGTSSAEQPKVSLPALASGNQIVPSGAASGGSDLAAGGPGSVTFRLPMSQLVIALGQWKDGRWTVVMTRSLEVESPDEGVSLEPGGKASVAFAVWDGSFQDRDGKKSITVWQDLEIEP